MAVTYGPLLIDCGLEKLGLTSRLSSIFLGTLSFNESRQLSFLILVIKLIPAYWYIPFWKKYVDCLPQNHKTPNLAKCSCHTKSWVSIIAHGWVFLLVFLHLMFFLQKLLYTIYTSWCGLSCCCCYSIPYFPPVPSFWLPIQQTT